MKEEEHRLYGRPCLLVQLYADGSVCFQEVSMQAILDQIADWL